MIIHFINFISNAFYKMLFVILLAFLVATGTSAVTVIINVIVLLGLFNIYLNQRELGLVIYK